MGKFLGIKEDWLTDQTCVIKGKTYNGRKTLYIFWIPVMTWGFNHSTLWLD